MTLSEEKKAKVIELYENGVNKKDIARIEGVSYPTIRNILNENDINEEPEKIKDVDTSFEKKLSEIFTYENYTEESILELLFNLKRIAKESGTDLGQFIEDIEFIFDAYYKKTENPIKLFNFLLDISNYLSLIFDEIEPDALLEIVDLYYQIGIQITEAKEYIAEIEAKTEKLVADTKAEYNEWKEKIDVAQKKLDSLTSKEAFIIAKLLKQPNKRKLEQLEKQLENAKKFNREFAKGLQACEILVNQATAENQELKRQNELLTEAFERLSAIFPDEVKSIVEEIKNESQFS